MPPFDMYTDRKVQEALIPDPGSLWSSRLWRCDVGAIPNALSGVTVVEFGNFVAGPLVGRNLAALGARVIKVERPGTGDDGRWMAPSFEGEGLFFTECNHNKSSIVLDLHNPAGRDLALELVQQADVVIENMRPSVMDKLGLGGEALLAANPKVVIASINGFGFEGPRAQEPAYDPIIQAATGLMFQQAGSDDDPPVRVGSSVIDKAASLWSTMQVLAALMEAQRTGYGQHVVTSLMAAGVHIMGAEILRYYATGRDRFDIEERDPGTGSSQAHKAADGRWIQLATGNDALFRKFSEVSGHPELLDDPLLATQGARSMNRVHEQRILAKVFLERPQVEWLDLLKKASVPATAINHISEFLADEVLSKPFVSTARLSTGEEVPMLLGPLDPTPVAGVPSADLPRLGAHTDTVLEELLQLDADGRARLAEQGAFGPIAAGAVP